MTGKTVRFADSDYLNTPSPAWSDISLPSTSGPVTPPSANISLPQGTVYLHPILEASKDFQIDYDVSLPSSTALIRDPKLSAYALSQPATNPPLPYLEVTSSRLPWKLFIWPAVRGSAFVSVSDVLTGIYSNLRTAVTGNEYAQAGTDSIAATFRKRCRCGASKEAEAAQIAKGVKRIDFLEGRNTFDGLVYTKQPQVFRMDTSG